MGRDDLRWFAKFAARRAAVALTGPASSAGTRVRVLTYHRFARRRRDPFAVAPERFEAQMGALAASGSAIGLDQLLRFVAGEASLPDDAVLVSIDDGAASTLEIAAPILRRFRIPAIAFITAGRIGRPADGEPERFLDADEAAALGAFGVEIGSHAMDHVSLGRAEAAGRMDAAALAHQLGGSKEMLERLTGREVRAFAYPFGTRRDFSASLRAATARAGYLACFTSQHGAITRGSDPLVLPRIKVEGGDTQRVFERARAGGLDAWILVDRTLNRLQAVGDQPNRT